MIKAFTLIELLIAMIITCLVIFFAYMFLDTSYRFFSSFKTSSDYISDAFAITSILEREFDESQDFIMNTADKTIGIPSKSVNYLFLKNTIIRNAGSLADTFTTGFLDFELRHETIADTSIDRIIISFEEKEYPLDFFKTKDTRQQLEGDIFLNDLRNGGN